MLIGSHFNFFFPTFSSQLPQGAGDISPTWQGSALCRSWDSGGEKKKCTLETGGICSWDGKEGAGSVHPTPHCSQGEEQLSGTIHLTWTQSRAQLKLSSARPCKAPPKKNSLCFIAPLWSTAPALLWKQGDAAAVPVHAPCSRGSAVQHAQRPRHCF